MNTPTKHRAILAAALLAAAGCVVLCHRRGAPLPSPPPITAPGRMVVATFNIQYGNPNLDRVVADIRRSEADVVCLQDVSSPSRRHLEQDLAGEYPHRVFRISADGRGLGFLSRRELTDVKVTRRPERTWPGVIATVSHDGCLIRIANVHLHRQQRLADTAAMREREIADAWAALGGAGPAIVAGDFNTISAGRAVRYLKARGLVDSFASVVGDADRHATWWPRKGPVGVARRIDFIFHTPEMRTTASRLIVGGSSDHALVVSTLEWGGPQQ